MKLFSSPERASGVVTVKIPFDKQVPTIFARTVPNQVFDKGNVVGVQLTYTNLSMIVT